jgi:hypothetical protein
MARIPVAVVFDANGKPICSPPLTVAHADDTIVWSSTIGDFSIEFSANPSENPFTDTKQKFTGQNPESTRVRKDAARDRPYKPTVVTLKGLSSRNGDVRIVP